MNDNTVAYKFPQLIKENIPKVTVLTLMKVVNDDHDM